MMDYSKIIKKTEDDPNGIYRKEVDATPEELELWGIVKEYCPDAELVKYSRNYLSGITSEHRDFFRFKYTDRTQWFSFSAAGHMKEYLSDPRSAQVEDTKLIHWKIYIKIPVDVRQYADWIVAAYEAYKKL